MKIPSEMSNERTDRLKVLRDRAEKGRKFHSTVSSMSSQEIQKMVNELDTYQIELELQNDDLRKTQQELDESRKLYADLYECAPVGYLTIDDTGAVFQANRTVSEILGKDRADIIHRPLTSYIADEDQDIYYRHRRDVEGSQHQQTCELHLKKNDGSLVDVLMASVAQSSADTIRGQVFTCITDISKQVLAETQLKRCRNQWEQSFNAIGDIITIQDTDRTILLANTAASRYFGKSPGEIVHKKCYEVFCGRSVPCENCTDLCPEEGRFSNSAVIANQSTGKIFQVTRSAIVEKGCWDYIVHVARDVTEEKRREDEEYQTRKMRSLGVLAGGIAHDFNNILSAILGFSELAKQGCKQGFDPTEDINEVITSGRRAVELVNQILTFSRKADRTLTAFEPHVIVKEALKMLRAAIPSSIVLEEDIATDCGTIMADPVNLHQIVVNLVTNARQSITSTKGTITVKLGNKVITGNGGEPDSLVKGTYVLLEVTDTGTGIEKDIFNRIFEPYFTTREMGKSSGFGLAIIHGIVKDYKGAIHVDSEPGKGARFQVYLPRLKKAPPGTAASEVERQSAKRSSAQKATGTILVVDDEESLLRLLKRVLERKGYTVVTMADSLQALERFTSDSEYFDLVITDQTMPSLTGCELAAEMLKVRPLIPIILCTGYSSGLPRDILNGTNGIRRFMGKPVEHSELIKVVAELLHPLS